MWGLPVKSTICYIVSVDMWHKGQMRSVSPLEYVLKQKCTIVLSGQLLSNVCNLLFWPIFAKLDWFMFWRACGIVLSFPSFHDNFWMIMALWPKITKTSNSGKIEWFMFWRAWLACAPLWQAVATGATTEAASCKNFTKNCAANMSDTTEYKRYEISEKIAMDTIPPRLNEFVIWS